MICRGVINGKAGKAAALPKFSDTLILSQSGAADYPQPLAHRKCFVITPLLHSVAKVYAVLSFYDTKCLCFAGRE